MLLAAGASWRNTGVNHVERNPSAVRNWLPVNVAWLSPAEVTTTFVTRPDGPTVAASELIGAGSFSVSATCAASSRTGPQSWYGERVSYGSSTETRYGTTTPVDSAADAVLPPEVEKNSASATLPA